MAFNTPTGNIPHLPIINLDPRRRGFAGLISDTSLLDVETIVIDKAGQGLGLIFRAGTIAKVTSVNPDNGTRRGQAAMTADAVAATRADRFVAISFSHDTCDQAGEIYVRNPDQAGVVNVKAANGVNTGRIWLFLRGAKPSDANGFLVKPMDVAETTRSSDPTKPFVNGAAGAEKDETKAIPGWRFTGHVDIDPATGYNIAEVEVNRA